MMERRYSIGEAARAAGVTVKAIRYYEEIGLIPPTRRRNNRGRGAGHRLFTAADVGRLRFIQHARALGLGLPEVRELVAIAEQPGCPGIRPEYREVLIRHLATLNERIEHLDRLRGTLEELLNADRKGAEGGCSWETCGCMDGNAASSQSDMDSPTDEPPPITSRSRRNKGGRHV